MTLTTLLSPLFAQARGPGLSQSPLMPGVDQGDLLSSSLAFLPELLICFGIVLLLVMRLLPALDRLHLGGVALAVTLVALAVSVLQWLGTYGLEAPPPYTFLMYGGGKSGLLVYDHFTVFLRCFLYGVTALVIVLSLLTGIPDREDSADFHCLLLGATLGMAVMASANHLLMVFLAVEMASLPSYALAGFLKGRRLSSEAALKYVVYGGGSAGIMLYGISLLAGKFGTGYLPDVAAGFVQALRPAAEGGPRFDPVLLLGALFLFVGLAFKLAAVPFHFWCPDVFEGASAEVAGFLSVASKGAALALLARVAFTLGGLDPLVDRDAPLGAVPWDEVVRYMVPTLAFFAALTATFGNLAAYLQTNLKRLLAYSTVAQAGYMMMGLSTLTARGAEAVLFYLVAYVLMNLGAFAVVAFLRNQAKSEDLDDFRGLVRRSPWMVVALCFFLLSLLGIPPLLGFAAKFQIFSVLYSQGQAFYRAKEAGLGATMYGLLVIGGLNTVLSAVYYLKVMKVMILDRRTEDLEGTEPPPLREPVGAVLYSTVLALALVVLGCWWGPLDRLSRQGLARFREAPGVDRKVAFSGSPPPPGGPRPEAPALPPRPGGGR